MSFGRAVIRAELLLQLNSLQLFYGLLLAAAIEDCRQLRIRNLWFVLICVFAGWQFFFSSPDLGSFFMRLARHTSSGLLAAAPLFLLYLRHQPVGAGDIKIIFAWGFCTSWPAAYIALCLGILLRMIAVLYQIRREFRSGSAPLRHVWRRHLAARFPLIPWLSCGVFISAWLPFSPDLLI